ncbi:MAG: hypothetical protein Q8P67_18145 [archaeon]|nr:hypothetical protein [archaeon]
MHEPSVSSLQSPGSGGSMSLRSSSEECFQTDGHHMPASSSELYACISVVPLMRVSDAIKALIKADAPAIHFKCKRSRHDSHGPIPLQTLIKHFNSRPDILVSEMIGFEYQCDCGNLL